MISPDERKGKSAAEISALLEARKLEVLNYLFPAGRIQGHEFCVGNLAGDPGVSLKVHLNGKGCVWKDFATEDKGGDLLDLWAAARCSKDLRTAVREAAEWLGISGRKERRQAGREQTKANGKGTPAGSWVYRDANGEPWIKVHRYNLPDGKKKFLQHDLKADKWVTSGGHQLSEPLPLYNLHLITKADDIVIFVEGEKCADALTQLGFIATSAMRGAQCAQLADYAPLAEKTVLLWRDNDEPGKHYLDVAAKAQLSVKALPHIVPIPDDKPESWDAADAIAEGWTREDILNLLAKATPYEPPRLLKTFTLTEFIALDIKPREMVIDPIIPSQGLVMLHAYRGVGKTLLAIAIADAARYGGKVLKWEAPKARRVLYVDGELPAALLQQRLIAQALATGHLAETSANLRILTPDMQESGIPDLATEAGQNAIEEWLDGIELLVLDNLSTLVRSGEENAAESWVVIQEWLLTLRRRGLSVLMLHHQGKTGLQRGTSKREDVLDTVMSLKHPADYQPSEGARFEIHFDKSRGIHGDAVSPIEAKYETIDGRAQWTWKTCADAMTDRVAELLNEGLSQHAIAKTLGIGLATVNRHKKKAEAAGKVEK